jgi:hypothetical protein
MSYNHNKFIKRSYSRETLRTYTPNNIAPTVYADFSFDAVLKMIENDPVARGGVNHFIDKCMEGDYSVITRDSHKYDDVFELLLDEKYQFRANILRKTFLMLKLFNNVFIEIVRDTDNNTKQLNVLDSTNIDVITEPNGDLIKCRSKVPDINTGKYVEWLAKDIVWIKMGDRTQGYAPVDLRALWENLLAKDYMRQYVGWLWKTGQYRVLYNFKNGASDKDVIDFLVYTRRAQDNPSSPIIAKGEMETKLLRDMKETQSLVELFKYYDGQTLVLLRVPPTDAGMPDASGRANSDSQSNNFCTSVIGIKKLVEDKINFELFPKIKSGNSLLKFSPCDRFAEKKVFEALQIMKTIGFTNEAMTEYLNDNGMYFKEDLFLSALEQNPAMLQQATQNDTAPSRTGKGAGEGNKKQSTVSTRENQMKK